MTGRASTLPGSVRCVSKRHQDHTGLSSLRELGGTPASALPHPFLMTSPSLPQTPLYSKDRLPERTFTRWPVTILAPGPRYTCQRSGKYLFTALPPQNSEATGPVHRSSMISQKRSGPSIYKSCQRRNSMDPFVLPQYKQVSCWLAHHPPGFPQPAHVSHFSFSLGFGCLTPPHSHLHGASRAPTLPDTCSFLGLQGKAAMGLQILPN